MSGDESTINHFATDGTLKQGCGVLSLCFFGLEESEPESVHVKIGVQTLTPG